MRIAICEDTSSMTQRLSDAIGDWAASRKIQVDVLCYKSAEAFIMAWPDISFDLTFLDIQMKNMTGIELAEQIRKTDENMMLVFVTGHSQYVLKGYDVNALHYLIKPLSPAKLLPILDKAYTIWRSRQNAVFLVPVDSGLKKIPYGEIYYFTMFSHTAKIQTADNEYDIRKTAHELIESLPVYFIRCHRSYIVNLLKADCVYNGSILMTDGKTIPVSRKCSKEVSDAFIRLHMEL